MVAFGAMPGFKQEIWIEVRVVVPPAALDAISGFFFDKKSLGITEEEGTDPERGKYVLLRAYFEKAAFEADKKFEKQLRAALKAAEAGKPKIYIEEMPYGDWAEGWKKYFKPRKLGRRIVVAPTWEEYTPQGDEILVRIDPGMAFGTGQHETTTLCVQALEDVVVPGSGQKVLDVGTGSGILAIAANKLGARWALGIDNDPEAVTAAKENVFANGLYTTHIADTPIAKVEGEHEIVVANILAEALISMAKPLAARVAPGGVLILSGILAHLGNKVADAFREQGLPDPDVRKDGEWVCLLIRKPA